MNCCQPNSFPYELLIAAIAVIISFISVTLTYWTIHIQQKHNKLSVKPIPEFNLSLVGGISIELQNKGIGPLFCINLITKNTAGIRKNHIKDFLPPKLHFKKTNFNTLRENFTLLPNETFKLITISIENKDKTQKENRIIAANEIGDLTLQLNYTSMYGETFPIYSKELIWFKNAIKNYT